VDCTVTEISDTAARLLVPNADFIPETFTLSLASGAKVQRQCTVQSRERGQISVVITRVREPPDAG
jgi:hypothetical protein